MLNQKKNFLFDIDGTLAVDADIYDGTKELLAYIDSIGGHAFFVTNNTTKGRKDYVEKFSRWGIQTKEEQFVTASYATCLYLKEHYTGKKIFVMGTASFMKEIEEFGLQVTDKVEDDVVCVLVGFDLTLNYAKIEAACELLFRPEVDYVGTNPDYCCPTRYGFMPDCGGICQMLNCTVSREPLYIGKPNPLIVDLCLSQVDGKKEESIVVGDRWYTDIACGLKASVETAVVWTGEARPEEKDTTEYPADYCFDTIRDFYNAVKNR